MFGFIRPKNLFYNYDNLPSIKIKCLFQNLKKAKSLFPPFNIGAGEFQNFTFSTPCESGVSKPRPNQGFHQPEFKN